MVFQSAYTISHSQSSSGSTSWPTLDVVSLLTSSYSGGRGKWRELTGLFFILANFCYPEALHVTPCCHHYNKKIVSYCFKATVLFWPCRKRETRIFSWFLSFKNLGSQGNKKRLLCIDDMIDMGKCRGFKMRFCRPETRQKFLEKSEERAGASATGDMDGVTPEESKSRTCLF